jgi:hypothetical protein
MEALASREAALGEQAFGDFHPGHLDSSSAEARRRDDVGE